MLSDFKVLVIPITNPLPGFHPVRVNQVTQSIHLKITVYFGAKARVMASFFFLPKSGIDRTICLMHR